MSRRRVALALSFVFLLAGLSAAQSKEDKKAEQQAKEKAKADAKLKSKDSKEKQKSREAEESGKALKQWLEEDVTYIITDEEKAAFKKLKTDEERYQFIEQFWLRRDPTPDTLENEFRDEHYARIAYANEHFASGIPGWKTDRGRIYITWGPPDSIDEDMPMGGTYQRSAEQGGGTTSTFPFVVWRYRYLDNFAGINRQEVKFEFVDSSMSGEYRLAVSPNEKDALIHVPNAGLTEAEQRNGTDKAERMRSDVSQLGPAGGAVTHLNQFDQLENYTAAFRPPDVKYKDLETVVTTKLSYNLLPFNIRTDFIRVFEDQVLTPITVSVLTKDLAFHEQDGFQSATGHIFGEIRTVGGRFVQKFDDDIVVGPYSAELYKAQLDKPQKYQKAIYLAPGLYKLSFVIKDIQSGNMGTTNMSFRVPRLADQTLASSSLIVADFVQNLPPRQVTGQFILGDKKVRPNMTEALQKNQDLNLWMQVYGLKVDPASHKPSAEVEMLITRSGREVKRIVEDSKELSGAAQQMTLVKSVPLTDFDPGAYEVQVKVTDKLSDGAVTVQSGKFSVR
jgi:GWxTD domain-containing protein